ncbi:MAG: transglycosylase SLT domain-containing protein [Paracoccus sp. (in: a-proteobacteria)]|nr:transglycosylase SLT domain-containing protein [Paracoccus sp. (in: a-proteobacteria)]
MYPFRHRLHALGLALLLAAPLPAWSENADALRQAWAAADQSDWAGAALAAGQSGPLAQALLDWRRLRAGQGSFTEYEAFLTAHPDWPGLDLLRRRGDETLRDGLPPEAILRWFSTRKPASLVAERAYLAALQGSNPPAAGPEISRFWRETPLSAADELAFLADYGPQLIPDHLPRALFLLDQGDWQAAERMQSMVPQADRPLIAARVALQARREGVDDLIRALPPAQRNDAGLAVDRFRWRVAARLHDPARDLMLERSTSAEALGRPEAWASQRADYARAALRAGDWTLAERLAANHYLPPDHRRYSDLEWLAGYAALRGGQPDRALDHFRHLETVVASPISTSRALYWQARAHEAAGRAEQATAAFTAAAAHQSAYYGQLAAERLGLPMDPALIPDTNAPSLPDWRGSALRSDPRWQAAVWLAAAGQPDEAQRFFSHIAETATPEDTARMSRLMLELHQTHHALRLAKAAAMKGAIHPAAYIPLTGLEQVDLGVPPELVMAISRQESEFNPRAGSHVGAQGLMQLMPATAQQVAGQLGMEYDAARLGSDPGYNAVLGASYLQGLRNRFGPSVALVAVGYNAGPGRSNRWLGDLGDIRRDADPVDWVELIPFDETRNYVMRVAEALGPYRARIKGQPVPIRLTLDLTGDGIIPPPPRARQTLPETLKTSRKPPRDGDPLSPEAAAFDDANPAPSPAP